MTVERDDLERSLDAIRAEVRDPRAGIYGPESASWRINREAVVMLGGGAAALLQLAHPYVAHAVDQHSHTRTDPLGRFQRTFAHVFSMVFGDLDHALGAARRVHGVHRGIKGPVREHVGRFAEGHRYRANDEDALFWVQATLVYTAVQVYELAVRALPASEKERYYAESRRFGQLFGIPSRVVPPTWNEFVAYYDDKIASDEIVVGKPALEMSRFLLQPPRAVHAPAMSWMRVFTAGLLPPKLRAQFELPWEPRHERLFRASLPALRASVRVAPPHARFFPAYLEARRRLAGKPERDRVARFLERVALKLIEPSPELLARERARKIA